MPLVLSRQRNERIRISFAEMTAEEALAMRGRTIDVMVVDIRGDKVRLGITAPDCVGIDREEVYCEMQREKAAAAANNGGANVVATGGDDRVRPGGRRNGAVDAVRGG